MIMNEKKYESVYDCISIIVSALVSVAVIFTFFFKLSTVVGESMENTLYNGDRLVITAINGELEYGDVVVVSQPNGYGKVLIKRVIAVGGQTVYFDASTGKTVVDNVPLEEPYIKEEMNFTYSMQNRYVVPEGYLFVMGDNRNNSSDSRDTYIGLIDERYVVGTVLYRVGDSNIFNSQFEGV